MKTTRLTLTAMLLMLATVGAWAQNAIAIHQKDGTVAMFSFAEKPVVTYSGNDLVLTTTKTSVSYPIYMLQKIDFDVDWDEATDIAEVDAAAESEQFRFSGNAISISGCEPGTQVGLYTVGGLKAGQQTVGSDGRAVISLQTLDKGIYVVKTKRVTFKFRKP